MRTKELQGRLWSASPSDWKQFIEPTFIPMYDSVISKIRLNKQQLLLDAGCGSGMFLAMAKKTGVHVYGIDGASGLLSIARKRLPGVTLLNEDIEDLPFPDQTFDIVTGFNSFQYASSFQSALTEARRVLKKNGKLVIGMWGAEKDSEAALMLKAVNNLLPLNPENAADPFELAKKGVIENICTEIGLKVISKYSVFCPWQFYSTHELLAASMSTAPCAKAVEAVGEEKVTAALIASAHPCLITDEFYYFRNYLNCFITERI